MSCPSVKLYFRSRMYHSKVMERYYITRSVSDGCLHKYYIMSPLSAHSKPGAIIFCYNNKRSNNTRLGRLKRSPKIWCVTKSEITPKCTTILYIKTELRNLRATIDIYFSNRFEGLYVMFILLGPIGIQSATNQQ